MVFLLAQVKLQNWTEQVFITDAVDPATLLQMQKGGGSLFHPQIQPKKLGATL